MNYKDINLISFFNCGFICFVINVYSDDQQNILKYLKDIEVNLGNILIIIKDLNIRNNDWNLSYPYHFVDANTLREIDSFDLGLSRFINQVPIRYTDNPNKSNSVIDLMFL